MGDVGLSKAVIWLFTLDFSMLERAEEVLGIVMSRILLLLLV